MSRWNRSFREHSDPALYYRFTSFATAIVVALSMVVLGSVLIFDRITSASHPMPAEPPSSNFARPVFDHLGKYASGAVFH